MCWQNQVPLGQDSVFDDFGEHFNLMSKQSKNISKQTLKITDEENNIENIVSIVVEGWLILDILVY